MQVCSSVAFAGALRRGGWATVFAVPFSLARERGLLCLFGALIIGTFGFNEIPNTLKRFDSLLRFCPCLCMLLFVWLLAALSRYGFLSVGVRGCLHVVGWIVTCNPALCKEDLTSEALDNFVARLRDVELLLIDEISTVGAGQFEMISRRLEQLSKALWRERAGAEPPEDLGGFGGLGIVLIGDFGQLPPVLASSLLPHSKMLEPLRSELRKHTLQGRLRFQEFINVVRLRRIHRQKGADVFKESTIRLRDAAVTPEDYKLWQEHVLISSDARPAWDGGEDLLSRCLVLVAENEVAGRVNGSELRTRAPALSEPVPDSFEKVVVRCESAHNDARAARRPADQFRQVRPATHLFPGARVMLSTNHIWGVPTVHFGLMNGARGVVVAIVYASAVESRADMISLAGVGYPEGADSAKHAISVRMGEGTGAGLRQVPFLGLPCAGCGFRCVVKVKEHARCRTLWSFTFRNTLDYRCWTGCLALGCRFPACKSTTNRLLGMSV